MSRLTLLILVGFTALTSTSALGLVVVDDDFNSYTAGALLVPQGGWQTAGGENSKCTVQDVCTTPGGCPDPQLAGRWEVPKNPGSWENSVKKLFPVIWDEGVALLYVSIMLDAPSGPGNYSYVLLHDEFGVEVTRIYISRGTGSTGHISILGRTSPSDPNPWRPVLVQDPVNQVWYNIKLEVDITSRKYDAYVGDGDRSGVNEGHWTKKVDDAYFYFSGVSLASVTWLMYRQGDSFAGTAYAYIDNLYIEGPDKARGLSVTEIWVARGTYVEKVNLREYAHLYGGFAATETDKCDRNGAVNQTIVDAGDSAVGSSAVTGANVSSVEGFTIRGGYYGVNCAHSSVEITNNLITGNVQAGVYCDSNSSYVANNTVVANNYGVQCSASSPVVTNSIIAYNATGVSSSGGAPSLSNNDVFDNTIDYSGISPGLNDLSVDAMFANSAAGDYHLLFGSPCIDNGNPSALPEFDRDGGRRPVDGDGDGEEAVDIGAYESQFVPDLLTVGGIRGMPDESILRCEQAVVTAAWPDSFYVEAQDRSSGIRVDKPGHGLVENMLANVSGRVKTDDEGERYVEAVAARQNGTGGVDPVLINNKTLGGSAFGAQQAVGDGIGLNNVGLLVTTTGRVSDIDTGSTPKSFKLDDGSRALIKVVVPQEVSIDLNWDYVSVTGISSCGRVNGQLRPLIRVRTQQDIAPLE